MKYVFSWMMVLSFAIAAVKGNGNAMAQAVNEAGGQAVTLGLSLAGVMMIWSGLSSILRHTGDAERLGRLIRRVLAPLFPGIRDEATWGAICLNVASNMLGLGNAATPYGIEAARLLTKPGMGTAGCNALAMLLVLNNSGLALMPTTVIALRAAAGSADPAGIWMPTLLSSAASTVTAVVLMCIIRKGEALWKKSQAG